MLTQRAAIVAFVAFIFYLIAVVNSLSSFYFALTWLTAAILAASFGLALLSLIGLECSFHVSRARALVTLGESNAGPLVRVELSNRGTLNKTGLIVELHLRGPHDQLTVQRFLFEAVPSGTSLEVDLPLAKLRRGRYQLEEVRLRGSDVLGLFRVQRKMKAKAETAREIIVGPATLRAETFERRGAGGARAGSRRTTQSGHGDDVRGTRPYATGDDLRHVHWKSTARAGELVVKEFEQTGRETALVVWDGAADTAWGSAHCDSVDWCLIVVSSLCRALLASHTPCDFARMDVNPRLVREKNLVNGELSPSFVEALADACEGRNQPLESAVRETPGLLSLSYSSVFLVTASLSPDVLEGARLWRSRGARVQIVLIDAFSLLAESRPKKSQLRAAYQRVGEEKIAVSAENYEIQWRRLSETGVEVIRVQAGEESVEATLRATLLALFHAPARSFNLKKSLPLETSAL